MTVNYCYANVPTLCGNCSFMMDGSRSDHSVQPFRYIVFCPNERCVNYGQLFELGEGAKIELKRVTT